MYAATTRATQFVSIFFTLPNSKMCPGIKENGLERSLCGTGSLGYLACDVMTEGRVIHWRVGRKGREADGQIGVLYRLAGNL